MSLDKSPKERATKKKNSSAKTKVVQGITATAGACTAAKAVKSSKNKGIVAFVFILIFAVGTAIGFFGLKVLTKGDGFIMSGEDFIEVQMYQVYADEGATATFFGKEYTVEVSYYYREDISYDAVKTDKVNTSVAGYYYVVYQTDAFLYKDTDLIRTVEVVRVEDDGQEK